MDKILIVDDTETNIDILVSTLAEEYELYVSLNGVEALEILEDVTPDLILLEIMMPEVDGYETIKEIKKNKKLKNIPVIFMSAISNMEGKSKGFSLGAVDYITKPFEIEEVKLRISTHIELMKARKFLKSQNQILEEKVKERTREIENLKDATIYSMAAVAETRDPETGQHITRTKKYVEILCDGLWEIGDSEILVEKNIDNLVRSAPLHDIGKVGVKDEILLKPDKLTKEEFEKMKEHTVYGKKMLQVVKKQLSESDYIDYALTIAYSHHEKWDGSGYPQGLKEYDIPLCARIMALADVYDALVNKRVYKDAFSHETAREIIIDASGSHFDPKIVNVFLNKEEKFIEISQKYRDDK
jgi:putative two-component system response regulator